MRKLIFLAAVLFAGGGWWRLSHREPPDITEDHARELADDALLDFCQMEAAAQAVCPYFIFQEVRAPADARFRWAFRYLDTHTETWKQVVVAVSAKGELSTEYTTPTPDPALQVVPAPPPFGTGDAAPAAETPGPSEARPVP